jgi:hypothetical protein
MSSNTYGYRTLVEESVSAVTATPSVTLGTRRMEGSTQYVYAYNGGSAANKGAPVIMTATSAYTFVVTFATGADIPCQFLGIVQHATCAAGSYCWVAVEGFADAYVVSNAVAIGDKLIIADGGGSARSATFTSSVTQLVKQGSIGQAMTAATAAATGTVGIYLR